MHQSTEFQGKRPDGKDQDSAKKLKGTSANTGSRAGDGGKAGSGSGNEGISQRFGKPLINLRTFSGFLSLQFAFIILISFNSAESGSEGSSNGSDENTNQQVYNRLPSVRMFLFLVNNNLPEIYLAPFSCTINRPVTWIFTARVSIEFV